jgi:hypothetical protein
VYVHWTALPAGWDATEIFLTFSCDYGDEFFEPDVPNSCPDFPQSMGARLSYLNDGSSISPYANWGSASVVAPNGNAHFIWPLRDDLAKIDQIYWRSLRWDLQGGPDFDPPLPPGDDCVEGETCEVPIIHDQPGIAGPGYGSIYAGLVMDSTNIATINHPSIGVDRTDPGNVCGFGGHLYVVYAAEEASDYQCDDQDGCVDSNIYVVRSRDDGQTWSAPTRINPDETGLGVECAEPACGEAQTAGMTRRPLQFYSWVAVDKQGRVGVMWHDTSPDFDPTDPFTFTPCDGNVIYETHFAYSLDGGVTWEHVGAISDDVSHTGRGEGPWTSTCDGVLLGEYSGLTATSGGVAEGIFHAIWADFREFTLSWRQMPVPEGEDIADHMGDIYSTKVVVTDPVYSMGDYDRDYDVDWDDFKGFEECATFSPECEILDFDRDGDVDNADAAGFLTCFTGPGESAGGGAGSEGAEAGMDDEEFAIWWIERLSPEERRALAERVRAVAEWVDADEATRLTAFAEALDARP